MPRNRRITFLFVLFVATAGCKPGQEAIFVDLDRVAASESLPKAPSTPFPTATPTIPASTLTLPAVQASAFRIGSDQERIEQVENVLLKSRQAASLQIEAQLSDSYRSSIEHARELAITKLGPGDQDIFASATKGYLDAFSAYAKARAPIVVKLALVAGFPDRDPQSSRIPPSAAVVARRKFDEAKPLRQKLANLDNAFRSHREELDAKAKSDVAARLQALNQNFDAQIAEADARARTDAEAEVTKEQEQLQSVLEDKSVVVFPPEAGRTVTVQGTPSPPAPPPVEEPGRDALQKRLGSANESDLKIWAALHGYVISSDRWGARDATADFIRWKKSHLASP